MGKYFAGQGVRAYAAVIGASLASLIQRTLTPRAECYVLTVGDVVSLSPVGLDTADVGTLPAVKGEFDGGESVVISGAQLMEIETFARRADRRRVALFTTTYYRQESTGILWKPELQVDLYAGREGDSKGLAFPMNTGDAYAVRPTKEALKVILASSDRDALVRALYNTGGAASMGSDGAVTEVTDARRDTAREALASMAASLYRQNQTAQHTADVPVSVETRLIERGLAAPRRVVESLMDSGVTDASVRVKPWMYAAHGLDSDAPELPAGMGADIEYAATYDAETMPAPGEDSVREREAERIALGRAIYAESMAGTRRRNVDSAHGEALRMDAERDAARMDATDYRRTGGVTRDALEYAETARAMGDTRFLVGERSDVRVTMPDREGNGAARHWTRVLNGTPYGFTAVTMPNGERRYEVSRYNGYGDRGDVESRMTAMRFGCAWSPFHSITVPAGTVPPADTPLDSRLARVAADALCDVFTPRGNAVTIAALSSDGGLAEVSGRLEYGRVYPVFELSYHGPTMSRLIDNRRSEEPFLYAAEKISRGYAPSILAHEGYTVSISFLDDTDSSPHEADCYSEADKAAWGNNEWRYLTLFLRLRDSRGRTVGDASVSGVESYASVGHFADSLESLYAEAKPAPMGRVEAARIGREIEAQRDKIDLVRRAADGLIEYARTLRFSASRSRGEAAQSREKARLLPSDRSGFLTGAANRWEQMAVSDDTRATELEDTARALDAAYNSKGDTMPGSYAIYFEKGIRAGVRVRVRAGIDVPDWATTGEVVSLPGPNSDYYDHPLVQWADGIKRHAATSWLEIIK
jgi:hypothetical protein